MRTYIFNLLIFIILLSFVDVSAMSDQESRIRALEDKIEALEPKSASGRHFNAHGVKKQGVKKPYHYKKGFHIESDDGLFSTNLQWRAQMRFANPGDGDPLSLANFETDPKTSNFELRRVRMKIGGHGYKPWVKYYFEIDLQPSRTFTSSSANTSARVLDWRLDVQPWQEFGFRIGQWKINLNRERVDSSGRQQFVERSIVNSIFTIDRQIGVMVKGRLIKGDHFDMRYYAGIFNGEGRTVDNANTQMMKMARLQWNLLGQDLKWRQSDVKRHEKPALQVAVGWSGNKGPCTMWSSSGCGNLRGFTDEATSNGTRFDINQWVAELAYKYQGLSIQSEYHLKEIKDTEVLQTYDLKGSYAQVGYFFNELNESIPEELELAFRYAFVDEPDSDILTLTSNREEYTAAANFFIAGHSNKITVDYSYLTLDDASSSRSVNDNRVRVQWDISF
jgi:phosphate-selective porin OprO and OprP